jgi:transposase-like protein
MSAVLEPKVAYSEERKSEILKAYEERPSMRGIERIFGVTRQTLSSWLKKG